MTYINIERNLLEIGYKVSWVMHNSGKLNVYIEYGEFPGGRYTDVYEDISIKEYIDKTPYISVENEDEYGIELVVDLDKYSTYNITYFHK